MRDRGSKPVLFVGLVVVFVLQQCTGVPLTWDEYVTIQGDDLGAWQAWVDYELRVGGEVVGSQTVLSSCRPAFEPGGGTCGQAVAEWDVEAGTYEVWFRVRWVNAVEGWEFIGHAAELAPWEDERHFLYWGDLVVEE